MSLLASFKRKGPSGFGYQSTAEQVTEGLDLTGKTYLLTGCNSGIGFETLRVLGLRGAEVIAVARTSASASAAIERATVCGGTPVACDLSEPASVRACVAVIKAFGRPLDAIICNAGIMALPTLQQKHGYELQFLTNHIGHFILVNQLLETLTENGRIVMVSSHAHRAAPPEGIQFDNLDGRRGYVPWKSYGQSKLANLLFAVQLAKRLAGSGRTVNALHPGVIRTSLGRHMNPLLRGAMVIVEPLFFKSVPQGAATQCYLATHPNLAGISGEYFADCNIAQPRHHAVDEALAERLWQASEQIVTRLNDTPAQHQGEWPPSTHAREAH